MIFEPLTDKTLLGKSLSDTARIGIIGIGYE
jgi:hypothetical protein